MGDKNHTEPKLETTISASESPEEQLIIDTSSSENRTVIKEKTPLEGDKDLAHPHPPEKKMPKKQLSETEKNKGIVTSWLKKMGWNESPFTFSINPELFVGYKEQTKRILMAIEEKHKLILLFGPTGSGKTTLLKWIIENLDEDFVILYIAKPPEKPEGFVEIFSNKFNRGLFSFLNSNIKNIYQIPDFLSKKLKNKNMIVLFDEAHESSKEVLEWIRVLSDQVNNMSVLISGLPVFEDNIKGTLETFRKRISAKVELLSLTKEETKELILRRIKYVGGKGDEFSDKLIDYIFEKTGGFPREILRLCDELVNDAIIKDTKIIEEIVLEEEKEEEYVYSSVIEKMTPLQKQVIELLSKNSLSPGQIVDAINLEKYKSRQHAVRSINNIVKKLYEDGFLERAKAEKTFIYSLSGKLKTLVVKA
jgi:type II secretory pathway predicted ATPase ExeA